MAWKQFETYRFPAKPSLVVNCCVKQTHAVLLLGFSLHIRQMSNIPRTPLFILIILIGILKEKNYSIVHTGKCFGLEGSRPHTLYGDNGDTCIKGTNRRSPSVLTVVISSQRIIW